MPIFKGMKPEHIGLIAGCASNVRFEPGDYIGRQGEPADKFWVIRRGRVVIEIHGPGRGVIPIQTVGEDDLLGWSWVLPPHQLHSDARALTTTIALEFDGRCLRGKFEKDYELGYEMMRLFSQLIVERLEATTLQLFDVYGDYE
jgi:CRP-like cAMP-binding protein